MKKYSTLIYLAVFSLLLLINDPSVWAQNVVLQSFTTGYALYGGSPDNEISEDVAVDETGARYITGYFEGTIDFDPGTGITQLTSAGNLDIFVAKYSLDGSLLWAKSFGGTSQDKSTGIAVDDNFVYLSGTFYEGGPITIGSTTLTSAGGWDMMVLKLNRTNGDAVWAKSYGTPGTQSNTEDVAKDITCDDDGNIYLTGIIGSTINGNNGTVISFDGINITIAGQLDVFIAKLNADGIAQWAKGIGSNLNAYGNGIWVSDNYVYTGGSFYGNNVDFNRASGPAFPLSAVGFDAFLTKHTTDGNLEWAVKAGGTSSDDNINCISTDAEENIYAVGSFSGNNVDFGNSISLTSSGIDAILWKISATGTSQWVKQLSGSGNDNATGVRLNETGEIYVAGTFEGPNFNVGNGISLTNEGFSDVFLLKSDASGNTIWAERFGSNQADFVYGLDIYGEYEVITSGGFLISTNFDPDGIAPNVPSAGILDFFLQSFTPTPEGTGTESDPFLISNLDELRWISINPLHWDKNFRQIADINAYATAFENGGKGWLPIGNNDTQFTGVYDGQGYNISNLSANRIEVGVDENTGLFGFINFPAVIKDLALVDASIRGDSITGSIVGKNYNANVSGCYSSGLVAGRQVVGGLVGENRSSAIIEDSYSTSTIVASETLAGGLCASNIDNSSISRSYSTGEVLATNIGAGGLVALNSGSTVMNSFWDIETSGLATSEGGEGKTTTEMTDSITFLNAGWAFKDGAGEETWNIGNSRNNGYPYLNWQFPNDKGMQFITFDPLIVKTYGDDNFELTASSTSGLEIAYESSNTDVATIEGSTVTILGAGSTEITAKQAGDENYHPAENVLRNLTVNKAVLLVETNDKTVTYGDDVPSLDYTLSGFVNNEDETVISGEPELTTAYVAGTPVTDSPVEIVITINTLTSANYDFDLTNGEILVEKAALSITAVSDTKIYGESDPLFTVSFDGFVLTDDENDLTGNLAIHRTPGEDVGAYSITAIGLTSENYEITYLDGALEITPAPLTITADSDTKVYGENDPLFAVTYVGFAWDDDETDLTGALTITRAPGENIGIYDIMASGLISDNYEITYVDGTLEITPASLIIAGQGDAKVYGFEHGFGGTEFDVTGLVEGDEVTSVNLTTDGAPINAPVGEYPIVLSNAVGTGLANYSIEYQDGILVVVKRTINIGGSFTVEHKIYDGTTDAFIAEDNLVLLNTVEGDDILLSNVVAEFESPGPGADISVVIVSAELAGTDKDNYALSFLNAPATTASIIDDTSVQDYLTTNTSLYPNPARTSITIKSNHPFSDVSILDLTGKVVKNANTSASFEVMLNVSDLAAGLYFVAITTSNGTEILKLQKTE